MSSNNGQSPNSCYSLGSGTATGLDADGGLLRDQLRGILEIEQTYRLPAIPCRWGVDTVPGCIPLQEWRRKICQWAFRVIDHFRLDREVVSAGMNIFDRFLLLHKRPALFQVDDNDTCHCPSCKRNVDSRTYQLAAMTAIFLAVKLHLNHGSERRQFKLCTFVELSRGQFHAEDINAMEQLMLRTLQWKTYCPTPATIVSYLLTLIPAVESHTSSTLDAIPTTSLIRTTHYELVIHVLRELSRYLTELATCLGDCCVDFAPSRVAYAALLVSMDLLTHQALPASLREGFFENVRCVCAMDELNPREPIRQLRMILERALWPEMLWDDTELSDSAHPIALARQFGLLDLDRLSRGTHRRQMMEDESQQQGSPSASAPTSKTSQTPPGSPYRDRSVSLEESPVSTMAVTS